MSIENHPLVFGPNHLASSFEQSAEEYMLQSREPWHQTSQIFYGLTNFDQSIAQTPEKIRPTKLDFEKEWGECFTKRKFRSRIQEVVWALTEIITFTLLITIDLSMVVLFQDKIHELLSCGHLHQQSKVWCQRKSGLPFLLVSVKASFLSIDQ